MASFKEYINDNKKKLQVVVSGTIITVVVCTLVWTGTRNNAYAVCVNGQAVAVVKEKEQVKQAYEEVVATIKKEAGVDIAVNEVLEVEPIHSKASEMNNYDELKSAINETISYGVEAYEILVNGVSYAVVENQDEANEILAGIAKVHLPNEGGLTLSHDNISVVAGEETATTNSDEGHAKTESTEVVEVQEALPQDEVTTKISVSDIGVTETTEQAVSEEGEGQEIKRSVQSFDFNEEVTVRNTYIDKEAILDQTSAKEKLLSDRFEVMDYELKEGDNIWDLAMTNGTTMERILELNPSIEDETKMQIGQVIKLEKATPILSITTVEEATYKELIPAEIKYVEFSDLYKDQTKVYQEGNDGLKELTVSVTKVNGEEVSRTLISEKVLQKEKIKVIAYGVKERPVAEENSNSNNSSSNNSSSSNSGSTSSGNSNSNSGSSNNSSSTSGSFIHPLKGAGTISSGYGSRWGSFHKGLDFAAPAGTPIYAAAAGKVIYSGYNNGGYGKLVIIEHSNGMQTYYAHCSSLYVNVGEQVAKGERIAGVGTTGDSTGNHLHFEVRVNGTPVNPSKYI